MNESIKPPPLNNLPVLQRLVVSYKTWQGYVRNFPKDLRYTLGAKIDLLFVETLEAIFTASYLARDQKLPFIKKATLKLDTLKFFLQVSWESKALDSKKYIHLSGHLAEIGRQLGGWQKHVSKENPTPESGERK